MRVLFIYPIIGTGEIPLNLSYLTAILKNEGHEVKVFDTSEYKQFASRVDEGQTSVGQFKSFKGRKDASFTLKDSNAFDDLTSLVGEFKPGLVCCTAFTNNYKVGICLLTEIKKHYSVPTLFGGIHTTLIPDKVLEEPCVDMICVGEGEGLLSELCGKLDRGEDISDIKNLWIKTPKGVIKNDLRPLINLDSLPFQDFDDYQTYNFYRPLAGKLYKSVSVDVSRGCPYRCSYCVNHTFQDMYKGLGKYHRVKSVEKAISNIEHLVNKYRVELVRFWDEDFTTLPITYLREFAWEYVKRINRPFLIYARVDTISEEKLKLLKRMGCITIAMGIESGSQRVRKEVLNRHMTDEKIINAFKMVKKSGIRCSAYNMIGLPHESRSDIFETIRLNRICKPDSSSVAFLEPYQNTRIFDDCVENGYIDEGYVATFDFFNPHIHQILISHDELRGILRTFMLYVKAPKILYPLVRSCERGNTWLYKILIKIFKGK